MPTVPGCDWLQPLHVAQVQLKPHSSVNQPTYWVTHVRTSFAHKLGFREVTSLHFKMEHAHAERCVINCSTAQSLNVKTPFTEANAQRIVNSISCVTGLNASNVSLTAHGRLIPPRSDRAYAVFADLKISTFDIFVSKCVNAREENDTKIPMRVRAAFTRPQLQQTRQLWAIGIRGGSRYVTHRVFPR